MTEQMKLVPVTSVDNQDRTSGSPAGYLLKQRYHITQGGRSVTEAVQSGMKFIELTEVYTPTDCDISNMIKYADSVKSLYTPILVEGMEQYAIREKSYFRVNMITKALSNVCFPFQGLTLLDLGCFVGYMCFTFESYGFSVHGIERKAVHMGLAETSKQVFQSNATFQMEDILAFLAVQSQPYDVILCLNVLHHLAKENKWGIQQRIDFVERLAALTTKAVVIAYPHRVGQSKGVGDISRWGVPTFASVEYLGRGFRYPIWICYKG